MMIISLGMRYYQPVSVGEDALVQKYTACN